MSVGVLEGVGVGVSVGVLVGVDVGVVVDVSLGVAVGVSRGNWTPSASQRRLAPHKGSASEIDSI